MGTKSGSGNGALVNKATMAVAVAALQLASRQIDAERATLSDLKKQLLADPECLSGDRAEVYQEFLDAVDAFCNKIADASIVLRNEASERNAWFNLNVDFKKIDAKAADSLSKAKATRAKKLKGQ